MVVLCFQHELILWTFSLASVGLNQILGTCKMKRNIESQVHVRHVYKEDITVGLFLTKLNVQRSHCTVKVTTIVFGTDTFSRLGQKKNADRQ